MYVFFFFSNVNEKNRGNQEKEFDSVFVGVFAEVGSIIIWILMWIEPKTKYQRLSKAIRFNSPKGLIGCNLSEGCKARKAHFLTTQLHLTSILLLFLTIGWAFWWNSSELVHIFKWDRLASFIQCYGFEHDVLGAPSATQFRLLCPFRGKWSYILCWFPTN